MSEEVISTLVHCFAGVVLVVWAATEPGQEALAAGIGGGMVGWNGCQAFFAWIDDER